MKIETKIVIGFLAIILLSFGQLFVVYTQEKEFIKNVRQIKEVETPLDTMTEQVIGYDAMLTGQAHAALLDAGKGDYAAVREHRARYDEVGVKLDDTLKRDAITLLRQSARSKESKDLVLGYLKELDRLNLLLVDLETRAFDAMEKGDTDTAYSLIVNGDYDVYKKELYETYRLWADEEHKQTLLAQERIAEDSQQEIISNMLFSIAFILILIILMMIIHVYVKEGDTGRKDSPEKGKV